MTEQPGLTSIQTHFVRLHNKLEQRIYDLRPQYSGERLYQETRRLVIAIWQCIVLNEFLPLVFGPKLFDQIFGQGNRLRFPEPGGTLHKISIFLKLKAQV